MGEVGVDLPADLRLDVLIAHKSVDDIRLALILLLLVVELYFNLPYLVDGIGEYQAGRELGHYVEHHFVAVARHNVPVADREHRGAGPVEAV